MCMFTTWAFAKVFVAEVVFSTHYTLPVLTVTSHMRSVDRAGPQSLCYIVYFSGTRKVDFC